MTRIKLLGIGIVLGALCFSTSACSDTAVPPVADRPSTRRALPLDSVAVAEKAAFDAGIQALAVTAPQAVDSIRRVAALHVHTQLGRLGYAAGPFDAELTQSLRDAIKRYERARSLDETGDPLSFALMRSLEADVADLVEQPQLPSLSFRSSADWLWLKGAWVRDRMDRQSTAVSIECTRTRHECVEAQALVQPVPGGLTLDAELQHWIVASWDGAEIITEPIDHRCVRDVLRINLIQQSATKIRSKISESNECRHIPAADAVATLTDGVDIAVERAGAAAKHFGDIVNLGPAALRLFADSVNN